MAEITLVISLIALILSILAFQRTGGMVDLRRHLDSTLTSNDLKKQMEALAAMTDTLREKTADALDRLEKAIRKTEKTDKTE
jgi:hypothetical protein